MTLDEVYKSLNDEYALDSIILNILREEGKRDDGIHANMGREEDLYTICEVIREIFKLTDNPEILKRCLLAQLFAKKMARRLKYYSEKEGIKFDSNKFFPKKGIDDK